MDVSDIVTLVQVFGVPVTLLLVILWTGARGKWVYGRTYDEMKQRAAKFEVLALRAVGAAEGGTEVAKQLAEERRAEIAQAVADVLARREAEET